MRAEALACARLLRLRLRHVYVLPHELRRCNTLPSFKSHLKTHYFRHQMDKSHRAVKLRLRLRLYDEVLCALNNFDN